MDHPQWTTLTIPNPEEEGGDPLQVFHGSIVIEQKKIQWFKIDCYGLGCGGYEIPNPKQEEGAQLHCTNHSTCEDSGILVDQSGEVYPGREIGRRADVLISPGHLWRDKWTTLSGTLSQPQNPKQEGGAQLHWTALVALARLCGDVPTLTPNRSNFC